MEPIINVNAVGPLQLCAGQIAGCEAAVHAMGTIFSDDNTEAMIFVDASNAFNSLNRQATLLNSISVCPSLAPILINTYRIESWLFVDGQCLLSKEGTTQGDPLAMAMYAIGTKPLMDELSGIAKHVWYANDSSAGSTLVNLRRWWDRLKDVGPRYGYFPNSSKTCILAKEHTAELAHEVFVGTGISISAQGKRYLGGALGSSSFIKQYMERKVEGWINELNTLSAIAKTQPHAAFAAFTHGLHSKWSYVLRVIDLDEDTSKDLLQPLENLITSALIPSLTGQPPPGDLTRYLLALPCKLGGLGLINPIDVRPEQYQTSKAISAPLVNRVINQESAMGDCATAQQHKKTQAKYNKQLKQKDLADDLRSKAPRDLQRSMELSQEKGASIWLTALPINAHHFALHKSAFRDALSLRYHWPIHNQPSACSCGHAFSIDHALSCPTGGYPSIRHNEVRDITASLMSEVCHSVCTEPHLQPLSGEIMLHSTSNTDNNSRLDVSAYGFWGGRFERAFFDVRVFNPCARSNRHTTLQATYKRHEQEKKRQYDQRVREIEQSTFTPLVFSASGGMGRAATTCYKRLAAMISEKKNITYNKTISWIRCRLSFSLLRSTIMAIRGTRSSASRGAMGESIALQSVEGHLQT